MKCKKTTLWIISVIIMFAVVSYYWRKRLNCQQRAEVTDAAVPDKVTTQDETQQMKTRKSDVVVTSETVLLDFLEELEIDLSIYDYVFVERGLFKKDRYPIKDSLLLRKVILFQGDKVSFGKEYGRISF